MIRSVSMELEETLSQPANDNHKKTYKLSLGGFINQDSIFWGIWRKQHLLVRTFERDDISVLYSSNISL